MFENYLNLDINDFNLIIIFQLYLQPWLMTPIMTPRNEPKGIYNTSHTCARNIIELCAINGLKYQLKFTIIYFDRRFSDYWATAQ